MEAPAPACPHFEQLPVVQPGSEGCEECLASGSRWVHLRMCLNCGHVGCCDQSPNRHARAHYTSVGHPVMRSQEPGEAWGWCWIDEVDIDL